MSRQDQGYTGVFWDDTDLPIPYCHSPYTIHENLGSALEIKDIRGDLAFWFYVDKQTLPDLLLPHYDNAGLKFITGVSRDKSARAKMMIRDILLWALDNRRFRNDEPANLVVVSNNISPEPELVSVLQSLEARKFRVLLVQSGKNKNVKKVDIPTESFDWLWANLFEDDEDESESSQSLCCCETER